VRRVGGVALTWMSCVRSWIGALVGCKRSRKRRDGGAARAAHRVRLRAWQGHLLASGRAKAAIASSRLKELDEGATASSFSWKWLGQVIGFAACISRLRASATSRVAEGNASTVWPAAGLAVAGLWWSGYRSPGDCLGRVRLRLAERRSGPVGAAAALISMLGPIVAVF